MTGWGETNTVALGGVAGGTCIGGNAGRSKLRGGGGLGAVAGKVTGFAVLGGAGGGQGLVRGKLGRGLASRTPGAGLGGLAVAFDCPVRFQGLGGGPFTINGHGRGCVCCAGVGGTFALPAVAVGCRFVPDRPPSHWVAEGGPGSAGLAVAVAGTGPGGACAVSGMVSCR